ncbi:hypothetical protein MTO96_050869 [Rhipicephalus appendiculatus]
MLQDKLTEPTSENSIALKDESPAINIRPRRATTLSAKAQGNYETSCEHYGRRTDAAWECVESAIFKLSSAHEESVDDIAAQLRSSYQEYRNVSGKHTAFLTATNTPEGQKELDMLGAIDADREAIVKKKLREATEHTCMAERKLHRSAHYQPAQELPLYPNARVLRL